MALYRHDSTGFLQEHASSPGAGYTAIAAMPTDTVANRVAWWRALDTHGQTSAWHPSEYRSPEDPAEAALTIRFSREAGFVSADPDGTVTDAYLAANTEVRVYRGSTDVTITEAWALSKVEDGCTSTLTESGGVYTLQITNIPLLATKQGYVRITATRVGVQVVRDFNFIKVLQGNTGATGGTGATVVLDNDSHTIPFTNGAGDYSGSGTAVIVYLGGTQLTAHATNTTNCFRITGASASGITAGSIAADKGSIGNHSAMTADTATVTLTIAVYGASGLFATITKKQTISRNTNGLSLSITADYLVVKKSSAGAFTPSAKVTFTPAYINLPPGKSVSDLIWYYSFTGGSSTTTGWDGSWDGGAGPLNLGINSDYAGAPAWSWSPDSQPPITIGIAINGDTTIYDRITLAYAKDGTNGTNGTNGADGTRGSRQILVTTASGAWDDTTAWNGIVSQTGTNPVPSDLVTIAKSDGTVANSKFYVSGSSPGTWTTPTAYINGNLLVTGTVGANQITAGSITTTQLSATAGITAAQINSNGLSIKDNSGNIILQAGTPLDTSYISNSGQNVCPSMRRWTLGSGHTLLTTETAAIDGCSITSPPSNVNASYSPNFTLQPFGYVASFKALMYGGASRNVVVVLMRASDSAVLAQSNVALTGSISRYSFTYTSGVTVDAKLYVYWNSGTAYGLIWEPQVERGATMTPWVPALQDLVSVNNQLTASNAATFIANASIGTAQIADASITNAKINDLSASKINTGTLNASVVSVTNLNASNITGGTLNASVISVTNLNASNITGGTLSVDRISANSITGGKISTTDGSAIGTTNINTGAITWSSADQLNQTTTTTTGNYTWNAAVPAASSGTRGKIIVCVGIYYYSSSTSNYTLNATLKSDGATVTPPGTIAGQQSVNGSREYITLNAVITSPPTGAFNVSLYLNWTASNTNANYYDLTYYLLEVKR